VDAVLAKTLAFGLGQELVRLVLSWTVIGLLVVHCSSLTGAIYQEEKL
jgi:hypothetical protein